MKFCGPNIIEALVMLSVTLQSSYLLSHYLIPSVIFLFFFFFLVGQCYIPLKGPQQ